MNISSVKNYCVGCSACVLACPTQCIDFVANEEGFFYPIVDSNKCVDCGKCLNVCPINATRKESEKRCFAAKAKNIELVSKSSSGAVFPLLANWVLQKKGIVYGAAFTDSLHVEHISITDSDQVHKLQSSKYVQSNLMGIYREIKENLSNKQCVLFSGTACQVEGLYSFLGDRPEGLFTVDIVCHGVPSEKAFSSYLTWLEQKYKCPVKSINFRSKSSGWKNYSVIAEFSNGQQYRAYHWDDPYMRAFIRGIDLRESCYTCNFRGSCYSADLTLGDLWGAKKICPEWDDDRGISLVISHSTKGEELFTNISDQIDIKEISFVEAAEENTAITTPCARPESRNGFYRSIQDRNFKKVVFAQYPDSIKYSLMKGLRKIKGNN